MSKKSNRYRSGFERRVANHLKTKGATYKYEHEKFPYEVRETRSYLPDFLVNDKFYLEVKGRLTTQDRKKLKYIKEQYPKLDLRLLFQRDNYLYKGSKTKYSVWAETNGFKYAIGEVPKEWLQEVGVLITYKKK